MDYHPWFNYHQIKIKLKIFIFLIIEEYELIENLAAKNEIIFFSNCN